MAPLAEYTALLSRVKVFLPRKTIKKTFDASAKMTKHSQIDLMDDDEFEDPETSQDPASQKFVEELYQFMEKRGTPIPSKLPQLGKRTLDLYRLFKEVYVRGGYDAVSILFIFLIPQKIFVLHFSPS